MGITTEIMETFPKDLNPFSIDGFHMGDQIGTNCMVMFPNFPDEFCKYVIVIDRTTGERIKVILNKEISK